MKLTEIAYIPLYTSMYPNEARKIKFVVKGLESIHANYQKKETVLFERSKVKAKKMWSFCTFIR